MIRAGCLAIVLAITSLGAPPAASAQAQPISYADTLSLLRPGDMLRIRVWPDATYGGEFQIEETGFVYLPALGAVQVLGVPLTQLREQLRARYRQEMNDPVVTITPVFRVTLTGDVARPGQYNVDPTHTIYDLISQGGGLSEPGDPNRIQIVRAGMTIELDPARVLDPRYAGEMLSLRSGDRVVVQRRESFWSRIQVRDVLWALQTVALAITLAKRVN